MLEYNNGNIGIGKSNPNTILDISGICTANIFSGSGAALINLNSSNINTGTLRVPYGGIGTTSLLSNSILVGNNTYPVITSSNLIWSNNTLSSSNFSGSGLGLTNLNASNINSGILTVPYGGIGTTTLKANSLLVGNHFGAIISPDSLTWDNSNNVLFASNISGSGLSITNLNSSNINTGTLSVLYGGIGTTSLTANSLLIGNNNDGIIASNNLIFTNNSLGVGKSPSKELDISGNINFSGNIYQNNVLYRKSQWIPDISNNLTYNNNIFIDTSD